jgi:predicted HTH domain antitoxin
MRITVEVPTPVATQPPEELERRARLHLVIDEVHSGRMTRGAATRALGMALDEFLIEAVRHGLYVIEYDSDDFRRELDAIAGD